MISRPLKSMLFSVTHGMKRAHFVRWLDCHRRFSFAAITHEGQDRSANSQRHGGCMKIGHDVACTRQSWLHSIKYSHFLPVTRLIVCYQLHETTVTRSRCSRRNWATSNIMVDQWTTSQLSGYCLYCSQHQRSLCARSFSMNIPTKIPVYNSGFV